jgi:hypothetical protein
MRYSTSTATTEPIAFPAKGRYDKEIRMDTTYRSHKKEKLFYVEVH